MPLRRAAAAVVWASLSASVVLVAWLDGALGPWPLSAFAYYSSILVIASGAGACLASALVLVGTIVRRRMEI